MNGRVQAITLVLVAAMVFAFPARGLARSAGVLVLLGSIAAEPGKRRSG